MNITQATDYGFRAVLFLAKQAHGKVVDAQTIAKQEAIPMRFLLKIMPSLIKAGIVRSQRGAGGGYYLAKDPAEITFMDVVRAVEGKVAINRCLIDPSYCNKNATAYCQVHRALSDIQEKISKELEGHNFKSLLEK